LANGADENNWKKEDIPETAHLFSRVHRNWLKDGDVNPGFFRNSPDDSTGGMSCDWNKYSTPEETKARAKQPEKNGVLQFVASEVREIPGQRLEHDPQPTNQAHSQVFGEKTPEVRVKLKRICTWIIPVES